MNLLFFINVQINFKNATVLFCFLKKDSQFIRFI